jgi:hypothetical protein
MPTANRRRFVPQAIEYFRRQDYPRKELLILDDGHDSIQDLVPPAADIHYHRIPGRRTLGSKRNQACQLAHGELLLHWDDDDWMAPDRIRRQTEALLHADADLCGLRKLLFFDVQRGTPWLYEYPARQRTWLAGGTLLYRRSFWQSNPFPDVQVGEDTRFVWSQRRVRVAELDALDLYLALIHSTNTSPKRCRGSYWSRWSGDVQAVLGQDWPFYQTLNAVPPPMTTPTVQLNLGCCDATLKGFINVDIVPGSGVDVAADLRQAWPWTDGSVDFVRAWDIIEHLPDKIHTMNELWRVLRPGGRAQIVVPTTDGSGAFQDPTHVSFWNRRSFLYYESGNPYRERFARSYGIQAKFRVVEENIASSLDGPRLTIVLEAVKPDSRNNP